MTVEASTFVVWTAFAAYTLFVATNVSEFAVEITIFWIFAIATFIKFVTVMLVTFA